MTSMYTYIYIYIYVYLTNMILCFRRFPLTWLLHVVVSQKCCRPAGVIFERLAHEKESIGDPSGGYYEMLKKQLLYSE